MSVLKIHLKIHLKINLKINLKIEILRLKNITICHNTLILEIENAIF